MTEFRTGYGAAWLDLLASLTGRYLETTRELLPDPEAARRWLAEHDLEPVAPVTEADLQALRALREAVHRTAAVRGDRNDRDISGSYPEVAGLRLSAGAVVHGDTGERRTTSLEPL
jgi:hypothetical protein